MNKRVTIDNLGPGASVDWAQSQVAAITEYFSHFPIIKKTEQAIVEPLTPLELDLLFDIRKSPSWASFIPSQGYLFRLKKLFQRRLTPRLDSLDAISMLDQFFEEGHLDAKGESACLYSLLEEIQRLDQIVEEIWLNFLSCLKS